MPGTEYLLFCSEKKTEIPANVPQAIHHQNHEAHEDNHNAPDLISFPKESSSLCKVLGVSLRMISGRLLSFAWSAFLSHAPLDLGSARL